MRVAATRSASSLVALGALAGLLGCAGARAAPAPPPGAGPLAPGEVRERLGIELQAPRLAAAGYLVAVACSVADAERAAPILARLGEARLAVEGSGAVLEVAGTARPAGKAEAGACSILFDNTRRQVAAGARVALTLGGWRVRDLTVAE
jgi:hypothetical protein